MTNRGKSKVVGVLTALTMAALVSACGSGPEIIVTPNLDASLSDSGSLDGTVVLDGARDLGTDAPMDAPMPIDATVDSSTDATPDMVVEGPGIVASETSGLSTFESGGTDTFSIVLGSQPTSDVTCVVTTSDSSEANVEPSEITFSSANWNSPQTLTVTGVDDLSADGDQDFTIHIGPCISADAAYNGLSGPDVSGVNHDDETPGIVVSADPDLQTSESGASVTFTVVLQTQPATSVSVALSSSDETEGTVTPSAAVFSSTNWNVPQLITVQGVDDTVDDGDVDFSIAVGPATGDAAYTGLLGSPVSITNLDDDMAGVTVAPTSIATTESGGTAAFTVVLDSQPSSDVTFTVTSSDETEGTVSPATLSFSVADWNVPQTVIVSGEDDSIADGSIPFTVTLHIEASSAAAYAALADQIVDVTNSDDELPGITVSPTSGLTTTEAGGTANFTVVLNSQPTSAVTLSLTSDETAEGTVSPATITFTPADWNTPQTVTVTGVDDSLVDGSRVYHVITSTAVSADPGYDGLNASDVSLANTDDDVPSVVIQPSGTLNTSEGGGTATFSLVLTSQPTADVTIAISATDSTEGTVSPSSVTFTAGNWNTPQSVVITSVDDSSADGNVSYSVITGAAVSTDMSYSGIAVADVLVTNADNDVASVVVTPTSGLSVSESGGTTSFTVVLTSQPLSNVTVMFSSSTPTEGAITPSGIVFSSLDWNTPHTVNVLGVDDSVVDGNVSFTVVSTAATSSDPAYSGLAVDDVSVTNTDNDVAGVSVTPTTLVTNEAGGSSMFTIVLTAQPSSSVTISLTSSDTTEGTVAPASLTFTPVNWSTPQAVTVTGVDDMLVDGTVAYTVVTGATVSGTSAFNGIAVADVDVTNTDNDTAGVTVSTTSGLLTNEAGGTATTTIVLTAGPVANVTISLTSSNTSEGTVSPATLTFTSSNWNTPQTVTLTGVNDDIINGDAAYTIVTSATSSTDASYNGLAVADISATNKAVTTYIKASNTGAADVFGSRIAVSGDGNTIAVAAVGEDSNATGIGGDQTNNSAAGSGAVYVFIRTAGVWTQQAYVKASNTDSSDSFGSSLALSTDGSTLAVGASAEDSNATGVGGDATNNASSNSGAVYVFARSGTTWSQQAYVKASNTDAADGFGSAVALNGDGTTLAVGSVSESSNATGVGGNQADNSSASAGAVYVLIRTGVAWSQQSYIKASNTGAADRFGGSVALSTDGNTLAVAAQAEASSATGVNGNQASNASSSAGAAYVFVRSGTVWTQEAYIKASNTAASDFFGSALDVSGDGNTLAVAAYGEDSNATGVGGDQSNNAASLSGAVYVFVRAAGTWSQQAYVKASNAGASDYFGWWLGLSSTGDTLAVGAFGEASNATGIGGDQTNNSASGAGAAYLFGRVSGVWTQTSYVKAPNTEANDGFGVALDISSTGGTLVVGANVESSNATGINGDQSNNSSSTSGAVYVY